MEPGRPDREEGQFGGVKLVLNHAAMEPGRQDREEGSLKL